MYANTLRQWQFEDYAKDRQSSHSCFTKSTRKLHTVRMYTQCDAHPHG